MNAVHETMSTSPITVEPTTSIGQLLALFDRYDFNAFPVVGQRNRLLGIISKLDVLELLLGRRRSTPSARDVSTTTYVADVMRRQAVSVEPRDAITAAGNLVVVTKLRSLPVVEWREGRPVLVGMLGRGDVLRWLRSQLVEGRYMAREGVMTSLQSVFTSGHREECEARDLGCRQAVEILVDEITEQSFPASDPPAWGIASSRLEQALRCSQTDQGYCSVHHT